MFLWLLNTDLFNIIYNISKYTYDTHQSSNGELGGYLGDMFPSTSDCLGVLY